LVEIDRNHLGNDLRSKTNTFLKKELYSKIFLQLSL
jgi:hypothetical protein